MYWGPESLEEHWGSSCQVLSGFFVWQFRVLRKTGSPAVGHCVCTCIVLSFLEKPKGPREAQRGPESHREAQRCPEKPRETQRSRAWIEQACHALGWWLAGWLAGWLEKGPNRLSEPQRGPERLRGPERPREAQRGPEKRRETQRGPESSREAQRDSERHREAQRGAERPRDAQRGADVPREAECGYVEQACHALGWVADYVCM